MPPETHATTDYSFLNYGSATYDQVDQSGGPCILSERIIGGEEVLASSSDSPHFQDLHQAFHQFWDESKVGDALQAAIGSLQSVPERQDQREHYIPEGIPDYWNVFSVSLFEPQPVFEIPWDTLSHLALADSSGCFFIGYSFAELLVSEDPALKWLESALHSSFEAELLEDGISHPAETILDQALQSGEGSSTLNWLKGFCLDVAQPSFAASVLRCLGRLIEPGTDSWRASLVRDGLAISDLEIRDAAVQAVESWGDPSLVHVLESHSEPVTWLHNYIHDVIDELAKDQRESEAQLQTTLAQSRQHLDDSVSGNFWKSPTLEELARVQNVQPIADVQALFGTWPGDEDDGFEAAVYELRHSVSPNKG